MIYRDLCINMDGGVVSPYHQCEYDNEVNIFIGLGGTGIDCLKKVKAKVYNEIKPDNEDEIISRPKYDRIRFLAIDTDDYYVQGNGTIYDIDKEKEFIYLGYPNLPVVIMNSEALRHNKSMQWLSDGIEIHNALAGAGGIRQLGRWMMMREISMLVQKITDVINSARMNMYDPQIKIHVLTGLSGGTGSGMFLDICYILEYIFSNLGIMNRKRVFGYFFLPDVNLQKSPVPALLKIIKTNGYAAMKELDYCMNFDKNGGEWNQNYEFFSVRSKDRPVDMAYLISATDTDGCMLSYDAVMDTVSEFLMNCIAKLTYAGGMNLSSWLYIQQGRAMQYLSHCSERSKSFCGRYAILGSSKLYVPYKEINTYLAAKVFEKMDESVTVIPDVYGIAKDHGFTYHDIENTLLQGVPTVPIYEVDPRLLKEQCQGITPDMVPYPLKQMRDVVPEIKASYENKKEGILRRMVSCLDSTLTCYCADPDKGPYYAASILHNDIKTDGDLCYVIDGMICENDRDFDCARADLGLLDKMMEQALRNLQNAKFFTLRRAAQEYIEIVHRYYQKQVNLHCYTIKDKLLRDLKEHIECLYKEKYAPLTKMLDNLSETFKHNMNILSDRDYESTGASIKAVDLNNYDLKKKLDEYVDELQSKKIISRFVESMLEKDESSVLYKNGNEYALSRFVCEFFSKQFSSFTDIGNEKYLALKYDTDDRKALAEAIYKDDIYKLMCISNCLFKLDAQYKFITEHNGCDKIYMDVTDKDSIGYSAAKRLNKEMFAITDEIASDNIIAVNRVTFCVSMCAYKFIDELKQLYKNLQIEGLHIYEGTELDERNFADLPDLDSESLVMV